MRTFGSAVPALALLERESCDVVLLDLKIGSENGLDVLKQLKANDSHIAVIMMTAYGSIGSSVEAMKNGAFTYLIKPLDIDELLIFIAQAVEFRKLNEQVLYLSDALRSQGHYDKIIGESEPMQRVYGLIDRLKDVDANVLITGESGTGKELVAKAIHDAGKRRNERFVVVNCAAIPENLLELEFSDISAARSPALRRTARGNLSWPTGGPFSWTRSATCPSTCKASFCACCKTRNLRRLAHPIRGMWMCA